MAKKNIESVEALKNDMEILKEKLMAYEQGVVQDIKERAMKAKDDFENKVEENPMASVGISFGAGIAAGMILYAVLNKKMNRR